MVLSVKLPNLKLKTRPKQLSVFLLYRAPGWLTKQICLREHLTLQGEDEQIWQTT